MNYDVTPHITGHIYPQMRKGSANSARCIVEMCDCRMDDGMMWGRLCGWMIESVTKIGWEVVTLKKIEI